MNAGLRFLLVPIVGFFLFIGPQVGFSQGKIYIDPTTGLPVTAPKGNIATRPSPQLPKLTPYPKPPAPKPTKKGQLTLKNGKVIHANVTRVTDLWVFLENLDTRRQEQYPLYFFHGRELERDTKKLDNYLGLEAVKPSKSEFHRLRPCPKLGRSKAAKP